MYAESQRHNNCEIDFSNEAKVTTSTKLSLFKIGKRKLLVDRQFNCVSTSLDFMHRVNV